MGLGDVSERVYSVVLCTVHPFDVPDNRAATVVAFFERLVFRFFFLSALALVAVWQ